MAKQSDIPMLPSQDVTWAFTKYIVAETMAIAQRIVIVVYILFKVTTCLYLSPSNKARSLSTLIEVIVIKHAEHKTKLVTYLKSKE